METLPRSDIAPALHSFVLFSQCQAFGLRLPRACLDPTSVWGPPDHGRTESGHAPHFLPLLEHCRTAPLSRTRLRAAFAAHPALRLDPDLPGTGDGHRRARPSADPCTPVGPRRVPRTRCPDADADAAPRTASTPRRCSRPPVSAAAGAHPACTGRLPGTVPLHRPSACACAWPCTRA